MIATLLVHTAIWTQFAVAHTVDMKFDFAAMFKAEPQPQTMLQDCGLVNESEPPVERIVIRETTLSEKYGLGVETEGWEWEGKWYGFSRGRDMPLNDQQKEIAAVGADARRLTPSTDWLAGRKDVFSTKPKFSLALQTNWQKEFSVRWDDDGGLWFGRRYFPPKEPEVFNFFISFAH